MEARAGYRPVPGPVDRATFFAEQRRNRRASWVFGLFAFVAVITTGVPLSIVVAPLLYVAILPIGVVVAMLHPHSAWDLLLVAPAMILPALVAFTLDPSHIKVNDLQGQHALQSAGPVLIAACWLVVLPGALVFLVVWRIVRKVFRRGGAGGVLLTLGARAPDPNDEEERRLVDVVGEIAVAAGVPAPRVVIIDGPAAGGAANAAVVGWSVDDATIVVTRPLVDQLTRDQTQAVMARVVASIGNGDLRIAFLMLSIFQSVGLVRLALHGVSSTDARRTLWRFARLALRRGSVTSGAEQSAEQQAVTDLLARGAGSAVDGNAAPYRLSCLGCLIAPVVFPLNWAAYTVSSIVFASEYLMTGPLVGAMWRRRELLADATAVQLTRNPDGLAGALERLRDIGVMVPHGEAVSYLFAAWWPSETATGQATRQSSATFFGQPMHAAADRRIAHLVAMGAHPEAALRPAVTAAPPAAVIEPPFLRVVRTGVVAVAVLVSVAAMMGVGLLLMSIVLLVLGLIGMGIARL